MTLDEMSMDFDPIPVTFHMTVRFKCCDWYGNVEITGDAPNPMCPICGGGGTIKADKYTKLDPNSYRGDPSRLQMR